jgi:uncharacterized protein (DUF983 family)
MERSKLTFLQSVTQCKCPKCRNGNLFLTHQHYDLKNFTDMNSNCPNCGQDFEIEPGFYLGAMWVSYPIVIFLEIVFILIGLLVFRLNLMLAILFSAIILLILTPPLIRFSRSLFIHLNVSFSYKA